ncbi:MAG: hypothetical protein JSV17_00180 [Candidatus Aminicenantes bacterium]|nr:MAG: hypothetical protein JSV17_00180 [Candidatus Aminicenantes bacterium]
MKKTLTAMVMVLVFSFFSWSEIREEQRYVNLSFTVWQLENGAAEAAQRINTPIPEVVRESWINDFVTFDISDGNAPAKIVEKDGFRFVLTAEYENRLTIQVYEKEKELFRLIHNRPSAAVYIFFGSDRKTYMMELNHTADNHPIGPLSPGIQRK